MTLRQWFLGRTKFEILSILLLPILILTIIILSTKQEVPNDNINKKLSQSREETRCTSSECIRAANRLLDTIDKNVNPCDNFYDFVCGNFINSDSAQSEISSFLDYHTNIVKKKLKQIVSESININDTNSLKLAKQLYQTCLLPNNDTEEWKVHQLIQDLGGWPLIEGNKWNEGNFSWIKTMIKARELGLNFNWLIRIVEDGQIVQISYPIDELKLDDSGKKFEKFLIKQIASYFSQNDYFNNDTEIDEIVQFADKLIGVIEKAKQSETVGNHLLISVDAFTKRWPQIDWLSFLNNITINDRLNSSTLLMNHLEFYFSNLSELLDKTPKRTVANYIMWRVILELSSHMSKIIQNNVINYFTIQAKKIYDLSDVCYSIVNLRMKNVLESEYYRRNKIVNYNTNPVLNRLIDEMKIHIENNQWLDKSSIENGVVRIDELKKMLGGFDDFKNATTFDKFNGYDHFKFSSSNIIDMITELKLNEYQTKFSRISKNLTLVPRIGSFDWSLANALFLFGYNTIVTGLGVLQDDFFMDGRPNYLNFGGIGWILSHELSHTFDYTYHVYIRDNQLIQWISDDSLKEYQKRIKCIVDEYNRIVTRQLHSNRIQNIVEDSADFIAADVAYRAYQRIKGDDLKLPNLEYNQNQLFWIQYSSFLCYKKVKTRGILDNDTTHSLPIFRVNGPLRNSKYFAKDFNCAVGTFMNPQDKCDLI